MGAFVILPWYILVHWLFVPKFFGFCFRGALDLEDIPSRLSRRDNDERWSTMQVWFEDKGFGFLTPDGGGDDCYVHRDSQNGSGVEHFEGVKCTMWNHGTSRISHTLGIHDKRFNLANVNICACVCPPLCFRRWYPFWRRGSPGRYKINLFSFAYHSLWCLRNPGHLKLGVFSSSWRVLWNQRLNIHRANIRKVLVLLGSVCAGWPFLVRRPFNKHRFCTSCFFRSWDFCTAAYIWGHTFEFSHAPFNGTCNLQPRATYVRTALTDGQSLVQNAAVSYVARMPSGWRVLKRFLAREKHQCIVEYSGSLLDENMKGPGCLEKWWKMDVEATQLVSLWWPDATHGVRPWLCLRGRDRKTSELCVTFSKLGRRLNGMRWRTNTPLLGIQSSTCSNQILQDTPMILW